MTLTTPTSNIQFGKVTNAFFGEDDIHSKIDNWISRNPHKNNRIAAKILRKCHDQKSRELDFLGLNLSSLPDGIDKDLQHVTKVRVCTKELQELVKKTFSYNKTANVEVICKEVNPLSQTTDSPDTLLRTPPGSHQRRGNISGLIKNTEPPTADRLRTMQQEIDMSVKNKYPPIDPINVLKNELKTWGIQKNDAQRRKIAAQRILDCIEKKSTTLDLSDLHLKDLPENFGALSHVVTLELRNNSLTKLPDSLTQFGTLKELDVSNNFLKSLPEDLSSLKSLQSLSISCNQIQTLPQSLSKLDNLQTLNAINNQLSHKQFPDLRDMKNLLEVDLSLNTRFHHWVPPSNGTPGKKVEFLSDTVEKCLPQATHVLSEHLAKEVDTRFWATGMGPTAKPRQSMMPRPQITTPAKSNVASIDFSDMEAEELALSFNSKISSVSSFSDLAQYIYQSNSTNNSKRVNFYGLPELSSSSSIHTASSAAAPSIRSSISYDQNQALIEAARVHAQVKTGDGVSKDSVESGSILSSTSDRKKPNRLKKFINFFKPKKKEKSVSDLLDSTARTAQPTTQQTSSSENFLGFFKQKNTSTSTLSSDGSLNVNISNVGSLRVDEIHQDMTPPHNVSAFPAPPSENVSHSMYTTNHPNQRIQEINV